jgi:hypothetical protein
MFNNELVSASTDKSAKQFLFENNKYALTNTVDFFTNYIYSLCYRPGGGFAVGSGN